LTGRVRRVEAYLVLPLALGITVSACSSNDAAPTGNSLYQTALKGPQPAGKDPSAIAIEVCSQTAQSQIRQVLGVAADVSTPTWNDHVYSCRYQYSSGSFVISVKELSSWGQTYAYFDSLRATLGDTGSLSNLGQGAFTTSDGSVVVRKDWKVLLVNIASLSTQFGQPPTSKAGAAYTIADIILACWAGD
jgi:hypothetical protein